MLILMGLVGIAGISDGIGVARVKRGMMLRGETRNDAGGDVSGLNQTAFGKAEY